MKFAYWKPWKAGSLVGRPGLGLNRKFRRLARALKSEALARGSLELLWDTAYENGDEFLGHSCDVESAAHWDGEPGELTAALLAAGGEGFPGFIEEHEQSGLYRVHDLFENAPESFRSVCSESLRENSAVSRSQNFAERRDERDARFNSPGKRRQVSSKRRTVARILRQTSGNCRANVGQTAILPHPHPHPHPLKPLRPNSKPVRTREVFPKGSSKPSHEAEKLSQLLTAEILRNKPDFRIKQSQQRKWANTADRMIRIDGRKPDQIAEVIRWAQRDEFWMSNILSMDKVHDKFEQLEMRRSNGKPSPAKVSRLNPVAHTLEQLGVK